MEPLTNWLCSRICNKNDLFDLYRAVAGATDIVAGGQRILYAEQRWTVSVVHFLKTTKQYLRYFNLCTKHYNQYKTVKSYTKFGY